MPSLTEQLAAYQAGARASADPTRLAVLDAGTASLKASGIEQRALQVGAAAPALTLPDALGRPVALADLWQRGPLVLLFYRGGWCPYCNLALRAWGQQAADLHALGASLAAISPQTPDGSLSTVEKHSLAYPVLSDSTLQASDAFGLSFELSPELAAQYRQGGADLPVLNGNGRWALPLPATYLIDRQGRIAWAHIEADYRQRADPSEVMARLAELAR